MSRPGFRDAPHLWLRTPRTAQTPAEYAYAGHYTGGAEHPITALGHRVAPWVALAGLVAGVVLVINT